MENSRKTPKKTAEMAKAMIAKFIVCRCSAAQRAPFELAQIQWNALSGAPGFCGQFGGWSQAEEPLAVILGLWQSQDHYQHFMRDIHDQIYDASDPGRIYEELSTTLFDQIFAVPGQLDFMTNALSQARFLRIADCQVREDRRRSFIEAQQRVWNPGMAESEDFLAGAFCVHQSDGFRFLVASLWRSEEAHERYQETLFPELHRASGVKQDCESVKGYKVPLVLNWVVPA